MLQTTAYWTSQGTKVAWFLAQYLLAQRVSGRLPIARPPTRPTPTLMALLADVGDLLRRDRENVAAGLYRLPDALPADPRRWIADAVRYFADLPTVAARRRRNGFDDVRRGRPEADRYPAYYRRNFHFQTDGYLSPQSAALYDHQVEVLFLGSADAMRRQALVPLARFLGDKKSGAVRLLDLACGTGRFPAMIKDAYPRLPVLAVDLSPYYLSVARDTLAPWRAVQCIQARAELLPVADGSMDVVTCIYLLHELPAPVGRAVAAEVARVLRPGGRLIVVDSLQFGDVPDYDGLLETFPQAFHEPFYDDYARTDLTALMAGCGLAVEETTRAFLSKVMVFARQ
jgi:ubiquinone/menaquinone biosynthesis C-methylase UbiE